MSHRKSLTNGATNVAGRPECLQRQLHRRFFNLPQEHSEAGLHQGLLGKLKHFLLEPGRDFCFVGSEFPVQVSKQDFALDLLFFHRDLNALVALA